MTSIRESVAWSYPPGTCLLFSTVSHIFFMPYIRCNVLSSLKRIEMTRRHQPTTVDPCSTIYTALTSGLDISCLSGRVFPKNVWCVVGLDQTHRIFDSFLTIFIPCAFAFPCHIINPTAHIVTFIVGRQTCW